jgi:hypothetical protein
MDGVLTIKKILEHKYEEYVLLKDGFQHPTQYYRFPPGSGFSLVRLVFVPFPLGNQILDPFPQLFRQFP